MATIFVVVVIVVVVVVIVVVVVVVVTEYLSLSCSVSSWLKGCGLHKDMLIFILGMQTSIMFGNPNVCYA